MTIDIGAEVARLEQMPVGELRDEYAERCGEMTSSRHRKYLIRKIAWRIQAQAEGGLTQRALQRAEALADDAEIRVTPPRQTKSAFKPPATTKVVQPVRDPRIPLPGAMLIRKYKRRTIRVLVAADGFEFEGERYKTLSAVAKAITGTHCNGFRFFKLGDGK